jgi:hypothetical protein
VLAGYRMSRKSDHTTGVLVVAQETKWWDHFGIGLGAGTGYMVDHFGVVNPDTYLVQYKDQGSFVLAVLLAPATLRFGDDPWFEFGLVGGFSTSFSETDPLGYLYVAVLF